MITVTKCEAVRTERRAGCSEDATYYRPTFDIVATTAQGVFVHPHCIDDQAQAEQFAQSIQSLDPEQWWPCTQPELPDYVTDWQRPEFN